MISPDDVRGAARALAGVAHRTPVVTSRTLDERVGASVFLKPENLQRGGAFKFRGAYVKISSLPEGSDVVAYSSGNHAQAVALAAKLLGSRATIVMPADAPDAKLDATRGYGAEVVTYDRWTESREEILLYAPRNLKAPPRWKHSALTWTRAPTRSSSVRDVTTGVRCAIPASRFAAASTSASSIIGKGSSWAGTARIPTALR